MKKIDLLEVHDIAIKKIIKEQIKSEIQYNNYRKTFNKFYTRDCVLIKNFDITPSIKKKPKLKRILDSDKCIRQRRVCS